MPTSECRAGPARADLPLSSNSPRRLSHAARGGREPRARVAMRFLPHPGEECVAATATSPMAEPHFRPPRPSGEWHGPCLSFGMCSARFRSVRTGSAAMSCTTRSSASRCRRSAGNCCGSCSARRPRSAPTCRRRRPRSASATSPTRLGSRVRKPYETRYWLRLRADMCPDDRMLPRLQQEADELCRVLTAILMSARRNREVRDSS